MSRPALMRCPAVVLFALGFCASVRAEMPLYQVEPYDQITLDAANDNKVLKVKPLDFPNRQPPPLKSTGKLVVHLVESPDKEYEVTWRSIVKLELFEQLVLNKANDFVAEGKYDEAYDYFAYLERNKSYTPGLGKAMEDYLWQEARDAFKKAKKAEDDGQLDDAKGQYDSALALLRELCRRNPKREKVDGALGGMTDKLIEGYVKKGDYPAARKLLWNLAGAFPSHPVFIRWRDRLTGQAAPLLAEARAAVESGQWDKAADLSLRIAVLWPELPGAHDLAQTIHQKAPRVVVGVGSFAAEMAFGRLDDWAARRTSRLLYRTLTEFAGASTEGGKYLCPVGEISSIALNRRLLVQLKRDIHWATGSAVLSGSDVSRRLLAMIDPNDPAYRVDWADLMAAVSSQGVYKVEVELRRPHVRPEAMLQVVLTPLAARGKAGQLPPPNGPFVVQSSSPQETLFVANRQYFAAQAGQPRLLTERRYPTVAQAVSALKQGEIHVLDRVNPWLLPSLRSDKHVKIQAYALPLVHCLIPNVHRPLLSDPTFRRALAYGIHREAILGQMLGGVETPGCVVTSSPFPVGVGADDPMSYATDENIEARPYEPLLTIALADVALSTYVDAQAGEAKKPEAPPGEAKKPEAQAGEAKKPEAQTDEAKKPEAQTDEAKKAEAQARKAKKLKAMPKLVLAYPPDEIARAACASIQKQLKLVGITVELRVIEGPLPARIPDDVDLLYAELATWEPLVDARRVLGENGLTGGCSPYMGLALRQLDEAVEWDQVRDCLRRVHRIAFEDVAILPLWQLVEHFACHDSLRGLGPGGVSLYQNIEQWRPAFRYPAEK
jgi:tetratricopeptide (TPR) repeat protein